MSCFGGGFMKIITDRILVREKIDEFNLEEIFSDEILQGMRIKIYEKGESVLSVGEILEEFLIFTSGKLKVFSLHENGKSLLLRFYKTFDTLGDIEILDNKTVDMNVEAVEESIILAVNADMLRTELESNTKFLKFLVRSLSDKLASASNNSSYNLSYPLVNRLASYLLEYVDEDNNIELDSKLIDISEFLGVTYRHFRRTMKELEDEGIIESKRSKIKVLNPDGLELLSKDIYNW